jgi:hypothetical protein
LSSKTYPPVLAACVLGAVLFPSCGGSSSTGPSNNPTPIVTPTPTPTPTPVATQPPPCQLTAPTVKCAERSSKPQELAAFLNPAIDAARATPGVMYPSGTDRIYDVNLFRSTIVDRLAAKGVCGAWDYGNVVGDEIFTRSADGCVVEQYDIIAGDGGVRSATKKSNLWSAGWGQAVPPPKPSWRKLGDQTCSLPGDRSAFCFSIKGSHGDYGDRVYALYEDVLSENPALIDKSDYLPGQGAPVPDALRPGGYRILNKAGYISAIETKIRANGFCGFVDGDILKVKSLDKGNVFHEEFDVIQNPAGGGDYTLFAIKDRCHSAGF